MLFVSGCLGCVPSWRKRRTGVRPPMLCDVNSAATCSSQIMSRSRTKDILFTLRPPASWETPIGQMLAKNALSVKVTWDPTTASVADCHKCGIQFVHARLRTCVESRWEIDAAHVMVSGALASSWRSTPLRARSRTSLPSSSRARMGIMTRRSSPRRSQMSILATSTRRARTPMARPSPTSGTTRGYHPTPTPQYVIDSFVIEHMFGVWRRLVCPDATRRPEVVRLMWEHQDVVSSLPMRSAWTVTRTRTGRSS